MGYPLRGVNASVASWGSTNIYSTILAAIVPASARYTITNNGQDVTGIGAFPISEIAGLISGDVTIGGFAGAAPQLGVYASVTAGGSPSGASTPYVTSPQNLSITLRTTGVHDITTGSAGSPATYMSFMPDGFQASARWTDLVDSGTGLSLPDPRTTVTFNQLLFEYMKISSTAGTITFPAANIRVLEKQAVRGNKQLVTYQANSSGAISAAGGIFGTQAAWGSSTNPFPLWNLGSGTPGALQLNDIGDASRNIAFADSFIKSMTINATPNAPVGVEISIQPTGAITIT